MVAAAIVVMGPAAGIAGDLDSPAAHPRLYLLALALSVLVGIAILANAAARAQPDRRIARLTVVPAAILSTVHWPRSSRWSHTRPTLPSMAFHCSPT
jgi:hypothetical protein